MSRRHDSPRWRGVTEYHPEREQRWTVWFRGEVYGFSRYQEDAEAILGKAIEDYAHRAEYNFRQAQKRSLVPA